MSESRWLGRSERWISLLLRLYPRDFREEMGEAVREAYRDRARDALGRGGVPALIGVWGRALVDSIWNGLGERARPGIAWRRAGRWGRDAELVGRRLVRAPLFAASIVGTLTVGLGAFAVVYAVVDKVLVEPLPYDAPDDLYYVWREYKTFDLDRGWLGGPDVAALREAGGVIEDAVGFQRNLPTLTGGPGGEPQQIAVMTTTPNLFGLLGVEPMLGRGFSPDEVGPDRPAVIVLTHGLWQQRFGGDPDVVGSEIRLSGNPYTVVGVMGPDFRFVRHSSLGAPQGADAYTTFDVHLGEMPAGEGSYAGIVRARPGTAPEALASAVTAVGIQVDEEHFEGEGIRLNTVGMKPDLVSEIRPTLVVLGLAGLLLVVVLMVNLATLLLVRSAQREREFAISRALGADRVALMRATLLEGGVLGLLGGAGGALVGYWATRVLVTLAPMQLPRREEIQVDWSVAAVVVVVGAAVGFLSAALPATWATRTRLSALLGAVAVRGGGGHGRLRRGMVVVQVALALVLLSAGGLVVRSFEQLLRANPGFDPSGVLTMRVPVPSSRYQDPDAVRALHARIDEALAALPGVETVGAASALPLTANASQNTIAFPGAPGNTGEPEHDEILVDRITARPGYFEALRIPVLAGRAFSEAPPEGLREVIIDRTLAAHFFPSGDPLGARMPFGPDTFTVVGVVEHARQYAVHVDDRPQIYLPNETFTLNTLSWVLRTGRAPMQVVPEARAAIWRVDPELAVADVQPMTRIVDDSLRQQRVSAVLISGFSLGALLLAAMGLFGVVAMTVTRRRHELAVRMALGAERSGLVRLVLTEGMALVLIGLLIGAPGIYLSARIISGVLVGVSPFDPLTLGAVALALAGVALLACYLPARRVTGIEPAGLLRQE